MKLQFTRRTGNKKSENKALRLQGYIPAVIYSRGTTSEVIAVSTQEFTALMRKVDSGRLSTTMITLVDQDGRERRAIVKDIAYEITTYHVIHLDFEELLDDVKVNVKVPIECVGLVDCIGVKLGGVLRQVIRYLKVRCLPKDIPTSFQLDVRSLGQRESRRLSDLVIPETIRPLANLNEVAVAIVKR